MTLTALGQNHKDALKAIAILEDYHSQLSKPKDRQLKTAIEKVVRILKSQLFTALLDIHDFYTYTLYDEAMATARNKYKDMMSDRSSARRTRQESDM